MSLITLNKVNVSYGATDILKDIDLTITPFTKLGIMGSNGCGKTTLLKAISGSLEPTTGEIFRLPNTKVGYLQQMTTGRGMGSLIELVCSGHPLWEIKEKIDELEETNNTSDEYIQLLSKFESQGGYQIRQKAEEVLSGLGFHEDEFTKSATKLSGGERERAYIARLLTYQPDLYLLDEPTNNIDYDGLLWLADFLKNGQTPYIVVSHDRFFLDLITTHIAEMVRGGITIFTGNYSDSREEREKYIEIQRKEYDRQKKMIAKEEEFIRRNIEGQKTKQAKSRRKKLEKLDLLSKPVKDQVLEFSFQPELRGGDDVLVLNKLDIGIQSRTLINRFSTMVTRGEKIGIFGSNGTGKTTLIRKLIEESGKTRDPHLRSGTVRWGVGINVGYFAQGSDNIDETKTPFDIIHDYMPAMADGEVRSLLAVFGIRGDNVFRAIGAFSGGEIAKVALIKLLLSGCNVLLLDEPTNHLDITAMRALEEALAQYNGTIIMVSHDRYFLRKTVDKIWAIENENLRFYDGGIDYYLESRARKKKTVIDNENEKKPVKIDSSKTPVPQKPKEQSKRSCTKLKSDMEKLEKQIGKVETEIEALSELMGLPAVVADSERLRAVIEDHSRLEKELEFLMQKWEDTACELY